jgi:MoaA/NifB/PqqE/SkfB family radical SAM enzyme
VGYWTGSVDIHFGPEILRMTPWLKALRYATYIAWKRSRPPLYLIHFVTQRCPANCRHCFLAAVDPSEDTGELTLEEIERFTRNLDPLLFVFLTGGEPFLRDDLSEIAIAYHRNAGVQKIQCPSNGAFPDKAVAFARTVSKACPDLHTSITISFDAVGEKHDQSRRCPGLFESAVETYRKLQQEEKRLPNFNLNATTTVSAFNQDDLEELYRFITGELESTNYFNTLVRGRPREPEASIVDIDKFERFNDLLESGMLKEGIRGYRRFPFADFVNAKNLISRRRIAETARNPVFQTPCYAGSIAGVLYACGDVYPCELLDCSMGNIRDHDYNLNSIWRSADADKIRESIHRKRCFCTHECFTTLNILFNPVFLPRLAREVIRLKWNRIFRRRDQ